MVARSSMAVLARRNRSPRLEDVVTTLLASRDRRAAHWPASATREAIAAAVPTPAVIMISRPLEMSLPSTSAIASRTRPTDRLDYH